MAAEKLASHKRFESRLQRSWPTFLHHRRERLRQHGRYGDAAEHVTENIVEDLLTAFTPQTFWKQELKK